MLFHFFRRLGGGWQWAVAEIEGPRVMQGWRSCTVTSIKATAVILSERQSPAAVSIIMALKYQGEPISFAFNCAFKVQTFDRPVIVVFSTIACAPSDAGRKTRWRAPPREQWY